MKHIVFACPAMTGHLNPMTSLGRAVERRGYKVSFMAIPDAEPVVSRCGFGFLPVGEKEFPIGAQAEVNATLGRLQGKHALNFTLEWLARSADSLLTDAPAQLRANDIDGVVADQFSSAVASAARKVGVPHVTACTGLAIMDDPTVPPVVAGWDFDPSKVGQAKNRKLNRDWANMTQPILDVYNQHHRSWGMPELKSHRDNDSKLAIIAQQPSFLDFPRQNLPGYFHYTGPWTESTIRSTVDFPFERLDGRPLVYASMGTLQNRMVPLFQMIAEAVVDLDVQLVMSLGRSDAEVPPLAGNPIVVPYAPQLELIRKADAVVTHAGLNTVLESLSEGVPLVTIPVTNDQPGVAARVAHINAGVRVKREQASSDLIRQGIEAVLDNPVYRTTAQNCRAELDESNGLQQAAEIITRAFAC